MTPRFGGRHAVLLARPDDPTERLTRRLPVQGLRVTTPGAPLHLAVTPADPVRGDADAGWDGSLPWRGANPPVPRPRAGCAAEACRALQREAIGRRLTLEQRAAASAAGPHRWAEAG